MTLSTLNNQISPLKIGDSCETLSQQEDIVLQTVLANQQTATSLHGMYYGKSVFLNLKPVDKLTTTQKSVRERENIIDSCVFMLSMSLAR